MQRGKERINKNHGIENLSRAFELSCVETCEFANYMDLLDNAMSLKISKRNMWKRWLGRRQQLGLLFYYESLQLFSDCCTHDMSNWQR